MPQISGCKARSCLLVFGFGLALMDKLNRTQRCKRENELLVRLNGENGKSKSASNSPY